MLHMHRGCFLSRLYAPNSVMMCITTIFCWNFNMICDGWWFQPSLLLICSVFALPFQKHGPRMKCSACKIIAHTSCINILMERTKFFCKATFRDVGVRQYREQTCIHHHWVHRRSQKGKCRQCGKVRGVQEPISECVFVCCICVWYEGRTESNASYL